jgi:hypothetical protein
MRLRSRVKYLYGFAIIFAVLLSVAMLCWWGYNFAEWSLEGAFAPVLHARRAPNANALMLLWTACTGLALTLTWELIGRYRQHKRKNSN